MGIGKSDFGHFWLPVIGLLAFASYTTYRLVEAHVSPKVDAPNYNMTDKLLARRGSIFSCYGREYPLVKSVPHWEYRLDPVALTNAVVRKHGQPPRTKAEIVKTIADTLQLDFNRVMAMSNRSSGPGWRSQFLAIDSDIDTYRTLADSTQVRGVAISDQQVRKYLYGQHFSHILGSVNAEYVGSAGIEQLFNAELSGTPGEIQGMRDAKGNELYDKRKVSINPIPGVDIVLTIDHNIQFEVEKQLKAGISEFGAAEGWCIVMDARTGDVLAMASYPDFDPTKFGKTTDREKMNRACAFTYEPGSVMKVITAASAIDAGFVKADTVYRTDRNDSRYYRLPGDGSHVWEPTMTVADAIVHSSNIVIGKLSYDFGPRRVYEGMRKFGFGQKTGIELPGEEIGILRNPAKKPWDKLTWSRAGIGQAFTVTALQLCCAYQAIANDGLRMKPHIIKRFERSNGEVISENKPTIVGRAISPQTARTMRKMMLGVASPSGTARRAAIRGYSVAGKTGTAQKQLPGVKGYADGLYRATFCGIVPASKPHLVVLVTLDFDKRTKFHQGGNSSGVVFRKIAKKTLRYLQIPPDRPEELVDYQEDEEID